jgi:hypothetical protein
MQAARDGTAVNRSTPQTRTAAFDRRTFQLLFDRSWDPTVGKAAAIFHAETALKRVVADWRL